MDSYSTLDLVEESLRFIEDGSSELFETMDSSTIEAYIYKPLIPDDFISYTENRRIKYYHTQFIVWQAYMNNRLNDEREKYLLELSENEHLKLPHFISPDEETKNEDDDHEHVILDTDNVPIMFYTLSDLMKLLSKFKNGEITQNENDFFNIIQDKIAALMKHTYGTHVIDVNEYEQHTLDNIFHVSEGWIQDIFCMLCDIHKLIQCGKDLQNIRSQWPEIKINVINKYREKINDRYTMMNKYDFAHSCNIYTIEYDMMLFERMKSRRIRNKINDNDVDTIRLLNSEYVDIEPTNVDHAKYREECFQVMLFDQTFQDVQIKDYYVTNYEIDDLMNKQVDAMDRYRNTRYFIVRAPPHVGYKFAVIDNQEYIKYEFDIFSEAMYHFSELSGYKLF